MDHNSEKPTMDDQSEKMTMDDKGPELTMDDKSDCELRIADCGLFECRMPNAEWRDDFEFRIDLNRQGATEFLSSVVHGPWSRFLF